MNDDLERELRTRLRRADLPEAPHSLRARLRDGRLDSAALVRARRPGANIIRLVAVLTIVGLGGLLIASLRPSLEPSGQPGPSTEARSTQPHGTPDWTIDPDATREPDEQWFGPDYPAEPPAGSGPWISTASRSDDHLVLTITFVGARSYVFSDGCSADYEPWAGVSGDVLQVKVVGVSRPHPTTGGACLAMGYGHTYHLRMPVPFDGIEVRDLNGGTFYLDSPPSALEATLLPEGWALRSAYTQEPGPPPIWVQVYGREGIAVEPPVEGPGRIVLYQADGMIGEWTDVRAIKAEALGGSSVEVEINGQRASLWRVPDSGQLLVAWTVSGRSIGLVGNLADVSEAEFVAIANGIQAPTDR